MYRIGIDIGATNMRVALFNDAYQLMERAEQKTEAHLGVAQALEKLFDMIQQVDPNQFASGIGIGAPGPLDAAQGIILDAPNLPGWHGFNLKEAIFKRFGKPVFLTNDAKVAALAEAKLGAGKGCHTVQFITVSTGVGGGFVHCGELFSGFHGHASEVGNMIVDVSGGNTLEEVCSGTALLYESKRLLGNEKTAKDLFIAARNHHPEAEGIVERWITHFSAGLTSMIQVLDPEIFVLGGAVMLRNPWLIKLLTDRVEMLVYESMRSNVKLRLASLGEDAGLYGAAMLVKRRD